MPTQHAYVMGGLSVFAQAGYLTLVQRASQHGPGEARLSTLQMIYVNGYVRECHSKGPKAKMTY